MDRQEEKLIAVPDPAPVSEVSTHIPRPIFERYDPIPTPVFHVPPIPIVPPYNPEETALMRPLGVLSDFKADLDRLNALIHRPQPPITTAVHAYLERDRKERLRQKYMHARHQVGGSLGSAVSPHLRRWTST
jgi:hypothetical protein